MSHEWSPMDGVLARVLRGLLPAVLALCAPSALAQNPDPLTPLPPHEVHTISREPKAASAPPPGDRTPEKIIQSFATHEDEYLRAHMMYGFKRSVRVQEFTPEGEKGGDVNQTTEVYLADNGKRYERSAQTGSQRYLDTRAGSVDVQKSAQVSLFPLTSNQLQYYDLTYKGLQPLDELHTYIFEVKPKKLLSGYRLFSGLVYIDDQDLAVVKIYGTWKSIEDENADDAPAREVPFSLYEMYYENVSGKYWFPTYIRSDTYVKTKKGDEQLRLTVRMTDFKVAAPAAAPPAPRPDESKQPDSTKSAKPRA